MVTHPVTGRVQAYVDVMGIVQYWHAHQSENFGFLAGCPATSGRYLRVIQPQTLTIDYSAAPVIPEPGTTLLVGTGVLGLVGYLRRRLIT